MQPQPRYSHRTADLVIPGIVDVLQVEGEEDTAPDVRGVEHFLDGFAAVCESAIAEKESQAAVGQICLMRLGDAARHKRRSDTVEAAMPAHAFRIHAQLDAFVIFRVGKRLVLSFVPPPPAESPNVRREFLLKINSEAILDGPLLASGSDIGCGRDMVQIQLNRLL